LTLSVERELRANLAVRVLYVFKSVFDQYATTNVLLPKSAYNIPLTRRDPGLDGVLNTGDDGGTVTIYDFDPAYRGAAFVRNEPRNYDRDNHYQTIEVAMMKRLSERWSATASFWSTKYHEWLAPFDNNPNADVNALDQAWRWAGNFSGTYELPAGMQVGAFVQSKIGVLGQRTNIFRALDPDGGPRLNQLSSVTLRLEPMGAQKGAAIHVIGVRASKAFALRRAQRIQCELDIFNLLNSSAQTSVVYGSGPTFGYATDVLPPRIARLGLRFSF
jgi:hypothetical protein